MTRGLNVKDGNGNEITSDNNIGKLNSLRYRGYYYDDETGLYYLQSRYYNPGRGRFINADTQFNNGISGTNLFLYCYNNPINNVDTNGHNPAAGALIGAEVGTFIAPGVGTFIGGIVGAVAGGIIIGEGLVWLHNNVKFKAKGTGKTKGAGKTKELGDAKAKDLKPLPKNKIKDLGGEDYTQPTKKDGGKSKSDLYWNSKTGDVYSVPKNGGIPQWVDKIPIK